MRLNIVGTMCDGGLVPLDAFELALGIPLVHQHDGVAEVERHRGPVVHGGVIERRLHDLDIVVMGLGAEERSGPRGGFVGIMPNSAGVDPLRPTGGARCRT